MRMTGKRTPILRIYNRAIVDEMVRKDLKTAFQLTDDIEVEWAGHPNWFFRMSKFSLPYLRHECVPKTWFLDRVEHMPKDLENYVVKPLFSFAGLGVIINLNPAGSGGHPQGKAFAVHSSGAHEIRAGDRNAIRRRTKRKCASCTSGWTNCCR